MLNINVKAPKQCNKTPLSNFATAAFPIGVSTSIHADPITL